MFSWLPRHRTTRLLTAAVALPVFVASGVAGYYYGRFSTLVEDRLRGERLRVVPRVYGRPLTFRPGLTLSPTDVVQRLNDLGYTSRESVSEPGEFASSTEAVDIVPRGGPNQGDVVRLEWEGAAPPAGASRRPSVIARVLVGGAPKAGVSLDAPILSALANAARERRRRVPLEAIPPHVQQAVLAIEDRRFYSHPGIDPIRMLGALATNLRGSRSYLVGASTITQQLARNFFLTEEMAAEQQSGRRSIRRKVLEQFMAIVLETKAAKEEILELYLNEVYLGNRGSFALHGVAVAARTFFAKDLSNVTLAEGALIAGVIQSPGNHSPFADLTRARERRDVVLGAMVAAGYVSQSDADAAAKEPLQVATRALDFEAPYFVDRVADELDAAFPNVAPASSASLDVHTTLDLNLQRAAQDAVRDGLAAVDATLAKRKRTGRAQAALVALDPRSGEVLALVGGRSYSQSQFNRATRAHRQPGSVFKPFVYLAAFDKAATDGRTDLTPASLVLDEPTTWPVAEGDWAPGNYDDEYDGMVTLRRALALSRNIAAIKVAEQAGFRTVASLWRRTGIGKPLRAYPSIALGVFELTPLEVAEAFTTFATLGRQTAPRTISRVVSNGQVSTVPPVTKNIAPAAVTYLVTNMMRGVMNEGTGASARAAGFAHDAAGKTGTTNDLRDAWFVGFTPELLAVVWVGLDDNQILGLSGGQSALPIWTAFMKRALAGRPDVRFSAPGGVVDVDIDRDTGQLALPTCPRVISETFVAGTEPGVWCALHQFQ